MFKLLIGMMKMKRAFKKAADEDLVSWPEGHEKLRDILGNMGPLGKNMEMGILVYLMN